ncbi:hypothetical protein [Clostridium novyi]
MLVYEDLPKDLKVMYSRKQCEAIIKAAYRLSIVMGNIIENIRRIIIAMQPTFQELNKKYTKRIESINSSEEACRCDIKLKYQQYVTYKPNIKIIKVCKKPIYYHIRSNC